MACHSFHPYLYCTDSHIPFHWFSAFSCIKLLFHLHSHLWGSTEGPVSFTQLHCSLAFLQFPQMSFCMTCLSVWEYIPVTLNHTPLPKTLLYLEETVLCIWFYSSRRKSGWQAHMPSFNKQNKFPRFTTSTCPKQVLLKSKENFKERREMKAARENTAS